jgi:hypothetical protein
VVDKPNEQGAEFWTHKTPGIASTSKTEWTESTK